MLAADGIAARVVSMPCIEWFDEQDAAYRDAGPAAAMSRARVSVEAGVALGWRQFVGDAGESISLEHFGASAAYKKLYAEFGITAEQRGGGGAGQPRQGAAGDQRSATQ